MLLAGTAAEEITPAADKGDENSGSQLQAPTVSVTGMDVVGERASLKCPIYQKA